MKPEKFLEEFGKLPQGLIRQYGLKTVGTKLKIKTSDLTLKIPISNIQSIDYTTNMEWKPYWAITLIKGTMVLEIERTYVTMVFEE